MVDEIRRARVLAAPSRVVLLHALQRGGPATVSELAGAACLHENTVREHLARLIEVGLVRREPEVRKRRGRPRMRYRAATAADAASDPEAAAAVAARVARTAFARAIIHGFDLPGTSTRERAVRAGADVGRKLEPPTNTSTDGEREVPNTEPTSNGSLLPGEKTADDAERAILALEAHLDSFGFDPEWDAERSAFDLWRCPFLAMAQERPDVVCGVHAGLAEGVLQSAGGAMTVERLTPFVGPEHCVLALRRS